ncbi:MAG: Gfo/Idh/MocA family oxidoreductase [bacterium]|nr:Gfo/Idh/MocA family oxidoreductase [bacterium]
MLKMAAIGCGYWGPNLIRNFHNHPDVEMSHICDLDAKRRAHMAQLYPTADISDDVGRILGDPSIGAVVVATPVSTHFPLGKAVLESGKHLFIEKPMAASADECRQLCAIAKARNLQIMVGHTFLFVPAVRMIKQLIESGELGDIYYVKIRRLNLGIFQKDANVVWDLVPHDVAMLNYLFDAVPERVSASGHCYVQTDKQLEDVAFVSLWYPGGRVAHLHVSWLDPNKVREATFVGSRKMVVYDDVAMTDKIRIYDKGVDVMPHYDGFDEFHLAYRHGDILIPKIDQAEPLKVETSHFVDCVLGRATPVSDGYLGLQVVEVLEKACLSIREHGAPQDLTFQNA